MVVKGFTLIEIIIAMSILGLLVGIGLPSYNQYLINSRRSEAMAFLNTIMQLEEQYFTNNLEYTTTLTSLGYSSNTVTTAGGSRDGGYEITASVCAPSPCVKLAASPLGLQKVNDAANIFTLDSLGRRTGKWMK